jgi:hypothetical protein
MLVPTLVKGGVIWRFAVAQDAQRDDPGLATTRNPGNVDVDGKEMMLVFVLLFGWRIRAQDGNLLTACTWGREVGERSGAKKDSRGKPGRTPIKVSGSACTCRAKNTIYHLITVAGRLRVCFLWLVLYKTPDNGE